LHKKYGKRNSRFYHLVKILFLNSSHPPLIPSDSNGIEDMLKGGNIYENRGKGQFKNPSEESEYMFFRCYTQFLRQIIQVAGTSHQQDWQQM
jgi:hypothetical protein